MTDGARQSRLDKLFDSVARGRLKVTSKNSALFLEAVCAQTEPLACLDALVSESNALDALQFAIFAGLSSGFLNDSCQCILSYFQVPALSNLGGGAILRSVLVKLSDPPHLLRAYKDALCDGELNAPAQKSFSWLLIQLLASPRTPSDDVLRVVEEVLPILLSSPFVAVKTNGKAIERALAPSTLQTSSSRGPGGRHDNDHPNFRDIAILPTAAELICSEAPYLLTSREVQDVDEARRVGTHLDNQFRLLREDMLFELREELQTVLDNDGGKGGARRGFQVEGFHAVGVQNGAGTKHEAKWGIEVECDQDLPFFMHDNPKDRKAYLASPDKRRILKHQSLTCLILDGEVVAFPTIHRDEEKLALPKPIIVLQLEGETATIQALTKLKTAKKTKLVQVDTAVFAYEPVLRSLQGMGRPLLSPELFLWDADRDVVQPPLFTPDSIISALTDNPSLNIGPILGLKKKVILDNAQCTSLLAMLSQRVSLIQGPPGTGKSFIGALAAKILYDTSDQKILICCFTNHALDQILEDLLDIGIPEEDVVRLGGKSTPRTEPLSLSRQQHVTKFRGTDSLELDAIRTTLDMRFSGLSKAFTSYSNSTTSDHALLAHLEFEDPDYHEAFTVPTSNEEDGMKIAKGGKVVDTVYLLRRWKNGEDPGVFRKHPSLISKSTAPIWRMDVGSRRKQVQFWLTTMERQQVEAVCALGKRYNDALAQLERKKAEKDLVVLQSKRIIGCTTTGAAMYTQTLQAAKPDVLLVEEAGEILESHVLTALSDSTSQIILIGDHLQLRPKVNNYRLTLEKGEGFDLNVSLFERLVKAQYPHQMLKKQHRMRPDISALVRHVSYPDLVDADRTQGRPDLRGVRDNVVFINHSHPEDDMKGVVETRDGGTKPSKQNTFEVQMVLKIVRYLTQQGYRTEDVVVLTPYLGQLFKLQNALKNDTDPLLSDMDLNELVRAGLISPNTAKLTKKPLRLSTIDNYQGEESNIVIISLTRSNAVNDIGFMFSAERLNVLLSRARDSCIIIGNADTFRRSRKGGELWKRLFSFMAEHGHVYEGLPVRCERHPDRVALLSEPNNFEEHCPDGGCTSECGVMLSCGLHKCPSPCHNLVDHSKLPCECLDDYTCAHGHKTPYRCSEGPPVSCSPCDKEARRKARRQNKRRLDREQQDHARTLAAIQSQIDAEHDAQEQALHDNALKLKQEELNSVRAHTTQSPILHKLFSYPVPPSAQLVPSSSSAFAFPATLAPASQAPSSSSWAPFVKVTNSLAQPLPISESQTKWDSQKCYYGASNSHIDAIMAMTGLESVKRQVLEIRDRIELSKRQGASMSKERFNVSLLGNPGTGKTTVARHYAQFLASVGLIPGNEFVEKTGSGLSNEGIDGAKKLIQQVLTAKGGAIFIDEAYQLVSEGNICGKHVLDFLLAEMENNIGKIVFILAGYNKEMERFFEHNPGIPSRVPHTLHFADYTDHELIHMFESYLAQIFQGRMKVEDGTRGLYARVAIRRLGRGRGRLGFGNARAMQNMYSRIAARQAARIEKERMSGVFSSDELLLTKEDMIGPDPSTAIIQSEAWYKLQQIIGLNAVKKSVQTMVGIICENYHRELSEQEPIGLPLNHVFLGNPGTGKTTIAKLYGRILADIGMLSNGEVIVKNPSDFKGQHIGHSEAQTKRILRSTVGKVLVIDEAYMLYASGGSGSGGNPSDMYSAAIIDTLVAEIQSVPGEDRCILLLGYEDKMREMFRNVNPGLSRRFDIEKAVRFDDFTDTELLQILELKMAQADLDATADAKKVAIDLLARARNRPNFGNGGDVENLLAKAKSHYMSRVASIPPVFRSRLIVFGPSDFDEDFDRVASSDANLTKLFEDVVDADKIIEKFREYQGVVRSLLAKGKEPRESQGLMPTTFVFKGPPGHSLCSLALRRTGKTTTALKMGKIYYDMGFLSSPEVIECSASDLQGQYTGHTGPKTRSKFREALGKVLLIDEAYRLGEGRFAQEAVDEIVTMLTEETYAGKLLVILAGYDDGMDRLMAVNSGLSSRFTETIVFSNISPARCIDILVKELQKSQIRSLELEQPQSPEAQQIIDIVDQLSRLPSWGNARDIKTLAKATIRKAILRSVPDPGDAQWTLLMWDDVFASASDMLRQRRGMLQNQAERRPGTYEDLPTLEHTSAPPPPPTTSASSTTGNPPAPPVSSPLTPDPSARDPGVSQKTWRKLQAAKESKLEEERKRREEEAALANALKEARKRAEAERRRVAELQRRAAEDAEAKRQLAEQRLREEEADRERERVQRLVADARRQEEEREKREARVQEKLQAMGVCDAGYEWIPEGSGYRCAGGLHYVSGTELGL
ncbi:P-loop containing nucleoside triphosphate hydrolase protein [Vararia minispora EC-137]|uniref:P-loop containing nucleoside triphosphate hydrolase protein n=1 Tax=Vararia minispora EC-137 TaxID=1314806 RepID=A0ACB8QG35_9AGAM|nr:P-loop containing nucleoside triphosphate hydrolase protein [Vararia minispora EC-137]